MSNTWESPLGMDFSSLVPGQEGTIIEPYSEARNGFPTGREVRATFPGGEAVLEITRDTQTNTRDGVEFPEGVHPPHGGPRIEKGILPPGNDKDIVAVVRFRVMKVLVAQNVE